MGIFKKLIIVVVLIASVVMAGIFILPGSFGEVGFNGGTAYLTTTVVGVNGERIVLEKQTALTQSIVFQGIEVDFFEYKIEIEFDGTVDVEIAASTLRARLNCDISCIVLKDWQIPSAKFSPGRSEIVDVNISAAAIEQIAPANPGGEFELKFVLELQWRPVGVGATYTFLDIEYPFLRLQKVDIVVPPPNGGGGGGGDGVTIQSVSLEPIVMQGDVRGY